ncbi:hypothetical protein BGX26_009067 [Mortierella sp. AD094]|nr:hypothetical protein BGX26_009067 [Mortierella sp. AD094]
MEELNLPEAYYSTKKIAITSVDSWIGYCSAYFLSQELAKTCPGVELVCLARKTEDLCHLEKLKNVHIHKTDYEDEKSLEKHLRDVNCVLLIPEMRERRVKLAKNVLSAMKNENVKSCLLLSVEGAGDASSHLKEIVSYHEIEKEVKDRCECYIILRRSFISQSLLYWAHHVREKTEFLITTNKDSVMVPIDMCDIIHAIGSLVTPEGFGGYKNKTFTLTGPQAITMEHFIQELSEMTGQEIALKQVSREDLKKDLESTKKHTDLSEEFDVDKCHQYPISCLDNVTDPEGVDESSGQQHRHHRHHYHHHHYHHHAPNESTVDLILDELELVKKGEAGFISEDLQKILGRPGKELTDFLSKEKNAFKPHHHRHHHD